MEAHFYALREIVKELFKFHSSGQLVNLAQMKCQQNLEVRKISQLVNSYHTNRTNRIRAILEIRLFALIFILTIGFITYLEKIHQIHLTPVNISYNIQIARTAHDC